MHDAIAIPAVHQATANPKGWNQSRNCGRLRALPGSALVPAAIREPGRCNWRSRERQWGR